ncbi:hypothetical protein QOT17_024329 [Balamuthia mandrillaris]
MSNELHKQRAAHEHELQTISKEHQDKMKELESRLESMRSRAQQILSGGKRRASKISVVSSQPLEDEEPKDPALGNRSTWDPSSNENSSDDAAEVISQCQRVGLKQFTSDCFHLTRRCYSLCLANTEEKEKIRKQNQCPAR